MARNPLCAPQAGPQSCTFVKMKKRIDQVMVEKGFCPSRTKAKELIERGEVHLQKGIGTTLVKQASTLIDPDQDQILLKDSDFLKYVSRAGHKLEAALDQVGLDVEGFNCIDIGASTGGFTDCLLQRKVKSVVCVDVGTGQLHPQIKSDPRVKNFESVNAKELLDLQDIHDVSFDLLVMDVSFISILKLLDTVIQKVKSGGYLLSLIKPQFEVGSVNIGKGGIVKSEDATEQVLQSIKHWAESFSGKGQKIESFRILTSQLPGRDGNKEYFLFLKLTEGSL